MASFGKNALAPAVWRNPAAFEERAVVRRLVAQEPNVVGGRRQVLVFPSSRFPVFSFSRLHVFPFPVPS
jgi:hypothetical protein